MLTYKTQVESIKLRCKKGLSPLKAMALNGIKRHLFLLHQSVILGVTDYVWVLQPCQSNLLKIDRVQNEATRVILGTTKDTPIETMRYLRDLPFMATRHKVEQVKVYLNAMQNPKNPLHDAVNRPAYPQIPLSVLQISFDRIFTFLTGYFPPRCTTNQSNENVSKVNFSIIHLVRTVCELTFSIIWTHYKTGTL